MCSGRGCEGLRGEVLEAALDYRYLLDRGYASKPSLDLVTSRYSLSSVERSLILRCVHDSPTSARILSSLARGESLKGGALALDLLNVVTTVISFLEGYLCDDGIVRDMGGLGIGRAGATGSQRLSSWLLRGSQASGSPGPFS